PKAKCFIKSNTGGKIGGGDDNVVNFADHLDASSWRYKPFRVYWAKICPSILWCIRRTHSTTINLHNKTSCNCM
ncbi:MAG: hypothetical protein RR223_08670, partial [Lachnospiraceae bacterium]